MPSIAVYGATGFTGRFVVAELLRRGFAPVAVARDDAKLAVFREQGIATRAAAVEQPEALASALAGAAAVINCAGPFMDTAAAVAAAALRGGSHYLDVTAEQPSALATFDRFGDAARAAGVVVVPAMGFYGGLADLLVTAAASGWDAPDEVLVGVALDSWHPTAGTRITGQRNTAPRLRIADGRLAPLPQPPAGSAWDFPAPFGRQDVVELPFSEVPLIARHLRIGQLRSFINQRPLRDLRDPGTPPPQAGSSQAFLVEAVVRAGADSRHAVVHGVDIYAVTAPIVGEAVARILDGAGRQGGAFAPGELFDADDFLRTLSPRALTFEPVRELHAQFRAAPA